MILGLILGIGIGLNIGLWLGSYLVKRWTKPLIEDYKKSVDYWYKNSTEWKDAYFKELTEGYETVNKYLKILSR